MVVLNSAELGRIGSTAALSVLLTLGMLLRAFPAWLLIRRLRVARRRESAHAG